MLFNSNTFLQFFAAFLLGYVLVHRNVVWRNTFIVLGSYLFYGWWDYRFLALILVSTLLDYRAGLGIASAPSQRVRRAWLWASIGGNLAILGFFKYCDFFIESFRLLLAVCGVSWNVRTLGIILPVGISFYTFQTMSYTIDVYRGRVPCTRRLIDFMAYVAFFPQLVAGPIERAHRLLPQFADVRPVTTAMLRSGLWLMIWGMFKKVVVADNLGPLVDMVYGRANPGGLLVVLATIAFAFQIYADFSGYSDIARGVARWLGFELMPNFDLPYAATSLRDFWRRWHISLSTWLRDYLYIGLGGNRRGVARTYLNIMITMLLGGLWHGAAWHFVAWGLWHGAGLVVERILCKQIRADGAGQRRWLMWGGTTLFWLYGWLLFRAGSLEQAAALTLSLVRAGSVPWLGSYAVGVGLYALPLIGMQIWQARSGDSLAPLRLPWWGRAVLQGGLLVAIMLFWGQDKTPFIYFRF